MITCYKRKEAKAKARCAPLTWSTAWRDPAWSCDACRPSRAPRRRTPPSTAAWPPHIAELPVASSRLCCLEDCCFVSMWFWDPIIALGYGEGPVLPLNIAYQRTLTANNKGPDPQIQAEHKGQVRTLHFPGGGNFFFLGCTWALDED